MMDSDTNRRRVLKTTGAALAGLSGLAGSAAACPGCGGDDDSDTPSVTTDSAIVNGSHVTVYGYLSSTGATDYADVWFDWGPEGGSLSNDTYLQRLYSTGQFCDGYDSDCPNDSFGSLSSGTYEYRAVGSNDYGTDTGSIKTFTI